MEVCLAQPAQPMVVKSLIFFLSDIGGHFSKLPDLFPKALEYVLTNGLLNTSFSKFFIDSNAVECLRNFSFECIELFTEPMILKTLEISEAVLGFIHTSHADKLIESIISIIDKLSPSAKLSAQHKVFVFVLNELAAGCEGLSEGNSAGFVKGVTLMSAALGALNGSDSNLIWQNLNWVVIKAVGLVIKCLPGLNESQSACFMLLKRSVLLCSTFSDCYFSEICEFVLNNYVPGKEEGVSVIISGITILYNEPKTLEWLNRNYLLLFMKLKDSLLLNPNPDIIEKFFDLQCKLVECNLAAFTSTLPASLALASSLCNFLSDRTAAKSLLNFCLMVFSTRHEELGGSVRELCRNLALALKSISVNAIQVLANLLNQFRIFYSGEFEYGINDAMISSSYACFNEQEKERIRFCFFRLDNSSVHQMKSFLNSIINILKGRGSIDLIVATEIFITSKIIHSK